MNRNSFYYTSLFLISLGLPFLAFAASRPDPVRAQALRMRIEERTRTSMTLQHLLERGNSHLSASLDRTATRLSLEPPTETLSPTERLKHTVDALIEKEDLAALEVLAERIDRLTQYDHPSSVVTLDAAWRAQAEQIDRHLFGPRDRKLESARDTYLRIPPSSPHPVISHREMRSGTLKKSDLLHAGTTALDALHELFGASRSPWSNSIQAMRSLNPSGHAELFEIENIERFDEFGRHLAHLTTQVLERSELLIAHLPKFRLGAARVRHRMIGMLKNSTEEVRSLLPSEGELKGLLKDVPIQDPRTALAGRIVVQSRRLDALLHRLRTSYPESAS